MLEKDYGAGVFCVHPKTSGGGQVGLLIESPVVGTNAATEGLLQGEVGLDPGDLVEFMAVRENDTPKITVLPRRHRLSPQKELEPIRNIATVGEDMETARGSAKGLNDCGDFSTLGSLPWPRHRSSGA